jgi:hypothetical protein
MPDQFEKYYTYLKSNGADVAPDFNSFKNTLSNYDNASKYYTYLKDNKFDVPETYDSFADTFGLKKKVSGEISSLTELPSEFIEPLKKGVSPNQTKEEERLVKQLGIKPMTGVTVPTNLPKQDELRYELELKTQDAAINTLTDIYKQKGLKFDPSKPAAQEQIQDYIEQERSNDLARVTGKDGKEYLTRGQGFIEAGAKALVNSVIEPFKSAEINFTNNPSELADLLDKKIAEEPNVPESAPTKVGGYMGGLLGGLPKLMGLLAIPYFGESAMVIEMYHNAIANERRTLYQRGIMSKENGGEGLDREAAAKMAMETAPITAVPDAAMGLVLARGVSGKNIIPEAEKKAFRDALAPFKDVAKVAGLGGVAGSSKSLLALASGYDVTATEVLESGGRSAGEYGLMDGAFKLMHKAGTIANVGLRASKAVVSAAKNLLSSVPKEILEVQAEKYPDGKEIIQKVEEFAKVKDEVKDLVPPEKVGSVAGLTEKIKTIQADMEELAARKEKTTDALKPQIDEWLKEYQDEIDFYNNQIKKVVKSKDPSGISEEIDDVTGEKIGAKKYIVDGKEVSQGEFEAMQGKPEGTKEIVEPTEIGGLKVVKRVEDAGGEAVYEVEGERFLTADGKELKVAKVEIPKEEVKPAEVKVTATEFFNRPVNGKIYKTNKTSAESNWGIKSVNGEYIVDEVVGNTQDIIKRPESLVKPLFDEANVSSPDDKIFVTKPAKLRKNEDGTFDVVEKGEIYYGKEAPKTEVKPTETKASPLKDIENLKGEQSNIRTEESRKIVNAVRRLEGLEPYTGPLDKLYSALKEADDYNASVIFSKLNNLNAAVEAVKNLPSYKGFMAEAKAEATPIVKTEVKPTEVKPSEEKDYNTLYHNSLNENLKLEDIDLLRKGQSQLKRSMKDLPEELQPSGFYTTDDVMSRFMGGTNKYSFKFPKNAKVKDLAAEGRITDRLGKKELIDLRNQGYDIIKGKNMAGQQEFIPLNKELIKDWKYEGPNIKKENGKYYYTKVTPEGSVQIEVPENIYESIEKNRFEQTKEEVKPIEVKAEAVKPKVEKQAEPKTLSVENKEYTTKTGRQKVVLKDNDLKVIDIKTGKEASPATRRKALDEYVERYDFSKGKTAQENTKEAPQGLSSEEVDRFSIEQSENPLEIASAYVYEEPISKFSSSKDAMIAEFGVGKITQESFKRWKDENLITGGMALTYFNKKEGLPLDVLAKSMSDHYGKEIDPQDIAEFIVKYPSGSSAALRDIESPTGRMAAERFKELTGLDLYRDMAEKIVKAEYEKKKQIEKDLIKEDYETAKQLEDAYWAAYKETDGFTKESPVSEVKPTEAPEKGVEEAYKDLTINQKRQIINSKFDELLKELKIEKICPT